MNEQQEAVFCIMNSGFADAARDAARTVGAAGGTTLKGRGSQRLYVR